MYNSWFNTWSRDPIKFLFGSERPKQVLQVSAEVALRAVVGANTIDHTMTEGRLEVQGKVKTALQKLLDTYQTGLLVTETQLQGWTLLCRSEMPSTTW